MKCTPKKDEYVALYILMCDHMIEEIFTNKTQAEDYLRELQKEVSGYHNWRIREMCTIGHEV